VTVAGQVREIQPNPEMGQVGEISQRGEVCRSGFRQRPSRGERSFILKLAGIRTVIFVKLASGKGSFISWPSSLSHVWFVRLARGERSLIFGFA